MSTEEDQKKVTKIMQEYTERATIEHHTPQETSSMYLYALRYACSDLMYANQELEKTVHDIRIHQTREGALRVLLKAGLELVADEGPKPGRGQAPGQLESAGANLPEDSGIKCPNCEQEMRISNPLGALPYRQCDFCGYHEDA